MPEAGKWNCIAPRLKATPSSATTARFRILLQSECDPTPPDFG